jgi:glycosyltransferase involved in cell wall biosynthesis
MFFLITFCVVFLIQLYFYVYLFGSYVNSKQIGPNKVLPPLSIIVCAKNEEENLKSLLPSLADQNYPELEIILIDDDSSDASLEIMRSFEKQNALSNSSIRIIPITKGRSKGKKYALTQGILASKNEVLLFTDADCKPASNDWAQQMSQYFSNDISLILGYGPYKKITGSFLNKLIRFETLLTAVQYFSCALKGKAYMGVGRNIAYKKEVFLKADGFEKHQHIKSGDDDLFVSQIATRYNTAICDDPKSFTYSQPEKTFGNWLWQKRRHITTSNHYSYYHKFLLGLFYLSQLSFYVLTFTAIIFQIHLAIILTLFLFRIIFWYYILNKSCSRLNEKDLIRLGPLYEISLIFIQLYIFLINKVSPPKYW